MGSIIEFLANSNHLLAECSLKNPKMLMNAVPRSAVPAQQHQFRRPTTNSRVTRTRAALSSNVTKMPTRTAGQKVEPLNKTIRRLDTTASSPRPLEHYAPARLRPTTSFENARAYGAAPQTLTLSQQLTPRWLSSLLLLKRSSDLITFLLVTTTLTIYSWTVYTQQQWMRDYRKLENLQRQERQLTTANAVMKNQLAQQAEKPATGLVSPTQTNAIFLPPAPQRKASTASTQTTNQEPVAKSPLGY